MNGLKALTFLQFYHSKLSNHIELYKYLGFKQLMSEEYYNLVSQPFTPDLITKYFEGWMDEGEGHYTDMNNVIDIDNEYGIIYNENAWLPIPKTLDAFIFYCQESGIELFFKPQSPPQG